LLEVNHESESGSRTECEGGYTVYVPSLPGCISEGDTKDEALTNIREAIELFLEPVNVDQWLEKAGE